jgi:hypothetical protein
MKTFWLYKEALMYLLLFSLLACSSDPQPAPAQEDNASGFKIDAKVMELASADVLAPSPEES